MPGVLLHGSGHWVAGEKRTAKRLLTWQGIGMALAAAGGVAIGVSGGADEVMPGLVLLLPGGGLVVLSWLADIYGTAGGARIGGRPAAPPRVEAEVGYAYVHDPQFAYSHLSTFGAGGRAGRFRAAGAGLFGEGMWRGGGEIGARVWGPLEVVAGATEHRFVDDGFAVTTMEVAVRARYELGRLDERFAGSFATGQLGFGLERTRYDVPGDPADWSSLFLGRFGYGIYLGDGGHRHAEVEVYYDHRRDQLTGGLLLPSGANGFVGHAGVTATAFQGRYGLTGGVDIGSAWVARLGVRFRFSETAP